MTVSFRLAAARSNQTGGRSMKRGAGRARSAEPRGEFCLGYRFLPDTAGSRANWDFV